MKKIQLCILLQLFTGLLISQSISSDWFYTNGPIIKKFAVANPDDLIVPEGGLDKIWDFSNATAVSLSDTLFEYYVSVESLPNFEEFPNADLGRINGALEFYFDIQEDAIILDGLYPNPEVVLTYPGGYPIGYAYSYNEPITRDYQIVTYNKVTEDTLSVVPLSSTLEIIGAGTVVTPEGEYENCILQKRTRILDGLITFESWAFFKDKYVNQLATLNRSINPSSQSVSYSFTYQTALEELVSGIAKDVNLSLEVYVSGNQIYIDSDQAYSSVDLQLLGMDGRKIFKRNEFLVVGENGFSLVDPLTQGQYMLFVLDRGTGSFRSVKFFIGDN